MVMFGAIYSGVPMPEITKDPNIPPSSAQTLLAGGGRRPFTQRIFMPGAGPAAIAVALAGNQNFCWDAGECRLRYAWQGDFVDAAEHWAGNGNVLAKLPTEPWWRAPKHDFPLSFGPADSAAPAVKFLGYRTTPAGPEFHYSAGGDEVFEQILPRRDGPGLALHYRIPQAAGPVAYRAGADAAAQWSSPSGPIVGGALRLSAEQARDFTLLLTSEACRP
jgi:hypothetical protein